MRQPDAYDILIYMSDQHAGPVAGFMGDQLVKTPNLDRIAKNSTVFCNAYTSCPLCVPARASFMTGRVPSELGVFGNDDAYSSQNATFVHSLAAAGYETVLCGRMHFIGEEQRHGFEKRIAGDISPGLWGENFSQREDMGDYRRTFAQKTCLEVIGPGDSPVLAYDRYVTGQALKYLSEDHERPQMMLVGTFAPHFPYAAEEKKMAYYREILSHTAADEDMDYSMDCVKGKMQYPDRGDLIEVKAAYYAMVETMDEQVGTVYDAFSNYLSRSGRKGIFVYLSDHGDQIGYKHLFGKQTFFEYSAKIPWLVSVEGIEGKRVEAPVSIMDVGSTVCGLVHAELPPCWQGEDLSGVVTGGELKPRKNLVVSEFFDDMDGRCRVGVMVREDQYKYIAYDGVREELLFQLEEDPGERRNLAGRDPVSGIYKEEAARQLEIRRGRVAVREKQKQNAEFLKHWGSKYPEKGTGLWMPPPQSVAVRPENKRAKYY